MYSYSNEHSISYTGYYWLGGKNAGDNTPIVWLDGTSAVNGFANWISTPADGSPKGIVIAKYSYPGKWMQRELNEGFGFICYEPEYL